MRYFKLSDDMSLQRRWLLGDPTDSKGQAVDEPLVAHPSFIRESRASSRSWLLTTCRSYRSTSIGCLSRTVSSSLLGSSGASTTTPRTRCCTGSRRMGARRRLGSIALIPAGARQARPGRTGAALRPARPGAPVSRLAPARGVTASCGDEVSHGTQYRPAPTLGCSVCDRSKSPRFVMPEQDRTLPPFASRPPSGRRLDGAFSE